MANDYLKELRAITNSTSMDKSEIGERGQLIDTGSFALNRIISGDIYGGMPSDRVIVFSGESATGKTLVTLCVVSNAIRKNKFDKCFAFDGEGGFSKKMMSNIGISLPDLEHVPVRNIEDAATKIYATYDYIAKVQKENPDFRCLLFLDSLGSLITRKAIKDMTDDNLKLDRGLRARMCNDMIKAFTIPALETGCGLIILNHVHDNPNEMYPSKIKHQSGGKGLQYMSRLMIQCVKSLQRNEERKEDDVYLSNKLKFMTIKNFTVVPFVETEIELDFRKGFTSKYSGLIPVAIKLGFIEDCGRNRYIVKSWDKTKKIKEIDLLSTNKTDEIWETFIKEFNVKQQEEIQYSSFLDDTPIAAASLGEEEQDAENHDRETPEKSNIKLI